MWRIQRRDHQAKQWENLGDAADLPAVTRAILAHESDSAGALFLSCYVDPTAGWTGDSDSEILSRFEYTSPGWFYLVTRTVQ